MPSFVAQAYRASLRKHLECRVSMPRASALPVQHLCHDVAHDGHARAHQRRRRHRVLHGSARRRAALPDTHLRHTATERASLANTHKMFAVRRFQNRNRRNCNPGIKYMPRIKTPRIDKGKKPVLQLQAHNVSFRLLRSMELKGARRAQTGRVRRRGPALESEGNVKKAVALAMPAVGSKRSTFDETPLVHV
eukprot:6188870-Pleurochrysis_carterae.AAC.3